jgi:hypothetical protein
MPKNKSVKTTVEQEKTTADKLAFNNKAVEAITKNAATRDALRQKNKDERAALSARRRASRSTGSSGRTRLVGLSTLNRPFTGDGLTS